MPKNQISDALQRLGNPAIAEHSQRFFKTGKGEYGEGDLFLGIRVPVLREQVKLFATVPLKEVVHALKSDYHEVRLCAILILVRKFERGRALERAEIYCTYLDHTAFINNWDLVDSSAHKIVGPFLADKDRNVLIRLAGSKLLWERRIAIIATLHFIKSDQYQDTLALSRILLDDREDLMHKAVGWMLREVGKRNGEVEREFLSQHYQSMPRTMLRYAIEKFPETERKRYLAGLI